MRDYPRQRRRLLRRILSCDSSADIDLLQSPAVSGRSISSPAIFISNGAWFATASSTTAATWPARLSLLLSEVQLGSWKEISRLRVPRLVPQNQIKSLSEQTAWCCRRLSAPYHGCYHTRDCTDLSEQGRKPRQGYLLLPSIFSCETTTIQGEGGGDERNESTRVFARQPRICLISFITHC